MSDHHLTFGEVWEEISSYDKQFCIDFLRSKINLRIDLTTLALTKVSKIAFMKGYDTGCHCQACRLQEYLQKLINKHKEECVV